MHWGSFGIGWVSAMVGVFIAQYVIANNAKRALRKFKDDYGCYYDHY